MADTDWASAIASGLGSGVQNYFTTSLGLKQAALEEEQRKKRDEWMEKTMARQQEMDAAYLQMLRGMGGGIEAHGYGGPAPAPPQSMGQQMASFAQPQQNMMQRAMAQPAPSLQERRNLFDPTERDRAKLKEILGG